MLKINIEDIEKKVIEIISESLGLDPEEEITKESSFNDMDVESLERVGILMDLEEEFDMEIPDEEAEKFQTVEDVIKYVEKQMELADSPS